MLKAVLFDDEYIVLEALGALVDWSGLGIELAGTAADGLSALEVVREVRPDIVLTDIRMPGKDGLQLIEEIMEEAPDTSCIVFSGFNEFEYVKRAIRLGVTDYVEKPITELAIESALRKALGLIDRREETRRLESKWADSKRELLEKSVRELLMFGPEAEAKCRDGFGPEAGRVSGITVMAAAEPFGLPEHPAYRFVRLRNEREMLAVVFHFLELPSSYWDDVADDLETAGIALGIGQTYPEWGESARSCAEARLALKTALLLQGAGAVRYGELKDRNASPDALSEREEAILLAMRAGNKTLLMEQVGGFLEWIRSARVDADLAEREMLKLIYLTMEAAREHGANPELRGSAKELYMPHVDIRTAAERGRLSDWFRDQIESIADGWMRVREQNKHAAVEKARLYIELNVTRDVSLQEAAEHVGLNPTYLSVLFKEVMGETYIKYLTRYRMELAKSLLRKGLKVSEVSEKVGYLTHRHFTEVFKKYAGRTPGQYRDS